MKCGKPYCACVGTCFAQHSPLDENLQLTGQTMPTDIERAELAQRIRNAMGEVRRKSYPLADLIPMMQKAANMLEADKAGAMQSFTPLCAQAEPEVIEYQLRHLAVGIGDWYPVSRERFAEAPDVEFEKRELITLQSHREAVEPLRAALQACIDALLNDPHPMFSDAIDQAKKALK